jgi:Zn-dependent alcohol dehydrogenase
MEGQGINNDVMALDTAREAADIIAIDLEPAIREQGAYFGIDQAVADNDFVTRFALGCNEQMCDGAANVAGAK